MGDWGRPQNDGPALRASTLSRFSRFLLHTYVPIEHLYKPGTNSLISTDLEYVVSHWRKPSYDIWEEVKGIHFYTLMVQRRALMDGTELANRMDNTFDAERYLQTAKSIEQRIREFWSPERGYIVVTQNRVAGLDYKVSGLDTQVLLAALHANDDADKFFHVTDDKVQATFVHLVNAFSGLYTLNRKHPHLAPGIGRYSEDMYNGYDAAHGGNPWMLLTAAMAETLYLTSTRYRWDGRFRVTTLNLPFFRYITKDRLQFHAAELVRQGEKKFHKVLKALVQMGDWFMERVKEQVKGDGEHLSEQWNRETGEQQGAEDLTWSYAAFVSAYRAREQALLL